MLDCADMRVPVNWISGVADHEYPDYANHYSDHQHFDTLCCMSIPGGAGKRFQLGDHSTGESKAASSGARAGTGHFPPNRLNGLRLSFHEINLPRSIFAFRSF
jgi:hypothetical protein